MRALFRTRPKKLLLIILVISFLYLIYQVYHLADLSSSSVPTEEEDPLVFIDQKQYETVVDNSPTRRLQSPSSNIFIPGVAPNEFEAYRMAFEFTPGKFQCLSSKELINGDLVNDDYCDCLDGTDEPSTSACSHLPNARFYCKSESCNHPGEHSIPSSRVNDGICDCCDGSDETAHISDKSKNLFHNHLNKYINPDALNTKLQSCFA